MHFGELRNRLLFDKREAPSATIDEQAPMSIL